MPAQVWPPDSRYLANVWRLFRNSMISYLILDETSGDFSDYSGNSRTGTAGGATGPTRNQEGIGDGRAGISLPGSAAYVDWYSAGLAGAFNGAEGSLIIWAKVSASGVWTDGTTRALAVLRADDNNLVRILRSSSNDNCILFQHIGGGTSRFTYGTWDSYTGWMMLGITWSATAGAVKAYVNGGQVDLDLAAPGTWSGSLSSDTTLLGAVSKTPASVWSGSLSHALLLDRAASEWEMLYLFRCVRSPKIFSIIGDSISQTTSAVLKWTERVRDGYNGGICGVCNHAVSGQSILSHMDAQVTAAANDNADIIIIQMGTNDVTGTGIQAEVEENITELKASNPSATIYYMNVFPRWTDETGDTEVDKSYIRTPVSAACTAQSITCWDTYTTPWITASDTSDGLHPNTSGHSKIKTEVLSRLP